MKRLIGAVVGAFALAGVFPAVGLATPINQTLPTVGGTLQVGGLAICNPGTWTNTANDQNVAPIDYQWFHSTNTSTAIHDGKTNDTYRLLASDANTQLICKETDKDFDDNTTASASSLSSAIVLPRTSLTITHYSNNLTGSIGESLAGVTVSASLVRPTGTGGTRIVASGSAATSSTGTWSIGLTPANPASGPVHGLLDGDTLTTHYAAPAATPGAAVPPDFSYGPDTPVIFGGNQSSVAPDGSKVVSSATFGGCSTVKFKIDGTTDATTPSGRDCQFTPASALTDANHVQVSLSSTPTLSGASQFASGLTTNDDVGLLGMTNGAPTCAGDLVIGIVTCNNLNSGSFAVSRNGGAAVALTTTPDPSFPGSFYGSAVLTGLKTSDLVTLDETAPAATTRHLTSLHLVTLRVDIGSGISGSCQPNEEFYAYGVLCPSSGTFTTSLFGGTQLVDDRSGGSTLVNVPSLSNLIPSPDDLIQTGNFTAYGDLFSAGTPAQTLTATKSVQLTIRPHGSAASVFSSAMTGATDSDGAFENVAVSGLAAGRFFASWLLTDSHGDTETTGTLFAVQTAGVAAAAPAVTSTAPLATTAPVATSIGSAATAHRAPLVITLVRCIQRAHRQHGRNVSRTTCRLSRLRTESRALAVTLTRGHTRFAQGTAMLRGRVARVDLPGLRRLRAGRYLLTITARRHGHRVVVFRHMVTMS